MISVRRGVDRAVTRTEWLDSRHSFSYGAHYDPGNTHFGLLLACNEDRLVPGAGFESHPHRDVEVLTWVVAGSLCHSDSSGRRGVARPGVMQRMSAGDGVRHAEHAGPDGAHYVQMWLRPAAFGVDSLYDTVAVASFASLTPLRQPDATLYAGSVSGSVSLPAAAYHHVLVVTGTLTLGLPVSLPPGTLPPGIPPPGRPSPGGASEAGSAGAEADSVELGPGDAARVTGGGAVELRSDTGAEVVAWGMRADLSVG